MMYSVLGVTKVPPWSLVAMGLLCLHLSHGLGLGGDLPRIARGVDDALRLGDALSCEPGLYIPGIGGARVENMLYIGDGGVETLTRCPLEMPMGF